MDYESIIQNVFTDTSLFFGMQRNFHDLLEEPRSFYIISALKKNEKHADFMFKKLSDIFNVSKSAITQGLNHAEHKGYIKRSINFKNRRLVSVEVTEKGELLYEKNTQIIYSLVKKTIDKIGEEAFIEFLFTTRIILETIQESGDNKNEKEK